MRHKITVPGAGVTKTFNQIKGKTLIVESANLFSGLEEVPLLGFNSGGNLNPVYPRSQYQYEANGNFDSITITGTTESAGSEIYFISSNLCLGTEINIQYSTSFSTFPGTTTGKTMDDTVQTFTEMELADADGNLPSKMYAYCTGAGNGINYAFNVNPANGATNNNFYLAPDTVEPIVIDGLAWMLALRIINRTNAETPNFVYTLEY